MERVLKLLVTLAAYVVLTCLLNLVFVIFCFFEFILHRTCATAASGFLFFSF